ncbi:SigB/SigF/SigG family RNA polymerase sigma factor [Dactylosporangium sp. NPDC000521]|uniref:SigB/SigF/SigG family RNA polymerase sigma factor n=1 Tax=Dactylosporangium sp. NPDC000521 TaxID=3363975 RepID=UPI0036A55290
MELTIALSSRDDEDLIELTGILDYASIPYLRHIVFELLDDHRHQIVVGASGLRLLDAASIKLLLYLQSRAEHVGGDLRLAEAGGTALAALEVTGVAKQLGVYDELAWPVHRRQREPVELDGMRVSHGEWPANTTDLLTRLHELDADDPTRRRGRDEVIELCLPTAHRLARRYSGGGSPAADLAQVAALGLVKAVDGFDPAHGVEFGAYATPTVLGEIKRHFRDRTTGIRMPRRLQELRLSVNKVRDELTQLLGHAPTGADFAAHLGAEEVEIVEMLGACNGHQPLSLDLPAAGAEDDTTLMDLVGREDPAFDLVEHREALRVLVAQLPEREQRILSLRFYGNLPQGQIATLVGLSQMHVSPLLRQSLATLRRRLTE